MNFSEDRLAELFAQLDADLDGLVAVSELFSAITLNASETLPSEQLKSLQELCESVLPKVTKNEFLFVAQFLNTKLKAAPSTVRAMLGILSTVKHLGQKVLGAEEDERLFTVALNPSNTQPARWESQLQLAARTRRADTSMGNDGDLRFFLTIAFASPHANRLLEEFPLLWSEAVEFLSDIGGEVREIVNAIEPHFFIRDECFTIGLEAKADSFLKSFLSALSDALEGTSCSAQATVLSLAALADLVERGLAAARNAEGQAEVRFTNASMLLSVMEETPLCQTLRTSPLFSLLLGLKRGKLELTWATEQRREPDDSQGLNSALLDFLTALDFVVQGGDLLRCAQVRSVSICAQVKAATVKLSLEGNFAALLSRLFPDH